MFGGRFADCQPETAEILLVFRYFNLVKFPGRNYINVVLNNLRPYYVVRRQLTRKNDGWQSVDNCCSTVDLMWLSESDRSFVSTGFG